jgi:hypothetical protein
MVGGLIKNLKNRVRSALQLGGVFGRIPMGKELNLGSNGNTIWLHERKVK